MPFIADSEGTCETTKDTLRVKDHTCSTKKKNLSSIRGKVRDNV